MIFHADQLPDRVARTESGEFLYFSGTAYLGIPHDAGFRQLLAEGMARYGTNFGSSRTGNLRLRVYEAAEAHLAQWAGSPAALLMSSGFLAGQLLVAWLRQWLATDPQVGVLYAPQTHPALWSGHETDALASWADWTAQAVAHINASPLPQFVVVANSVDSIRGQHHSFAWLRDLRPDKMVTLLADDSHGFGLLGPTGGGSHSLLPDLPQVRRVVLASLAKACGIPAGVVLGPPDLLAQLRAMPFYAGASPSPPAYLYALGRAQDVYAHNLARLRHNVAHLAQQVAGLGLFSHSPDYPVFFTERNDLYPHLLARQILVSSFPYPRAEAPPITRVVVSSLHTPADLARLAGAVGELSI
jgi:7-keto-8-aminopelargonate synthetase-like enzyme